MSRPACTQVLSLALVRDVGTVGNHFGCGAPLSAHYAQDALGVLYAPPTTTPQR